MPARFAPTRASCIAPCKEQAGNRELSPEHQQDVLRRGDQHDRVEVLERIEFRARLQRHVDRERLRAEMERVAVGRRLRRRGGADVAAGAGAVLDDDVLPPRLGQLLRDDPAERVDGAAGGERDQHANRPLGIALRPCAGARRKQRSRDHRAGGASAHLVS
jgi:hypothetical protein